MPTRKKKFAVRKRVAMRGSRSVAASAPASSAGAFVPDIPGQRPNLTLSAWLALNSTTPITRIDRVPGGWTVTP